MKNINDVYEELKKLNSSIEIILKDSHYKDYDDLSGVEYDRQNPEQRLLREELRCILDKLERASNNISYLSQPITHSGKLHKQSNGRYEIDGYELTSGSGIEVLAPCEIWSEEKQDYIEGLEWVATRIEHNGTDYYLVGYSNLQLEGMKARKREKIY